MRIAISQQTIKCSRLICTLTPSNNQGLSELVEYLTGALEIQPSEVVDLFRRSLAPCADPVYDHVHELAEWYDNNIQLPRLLIAICDYNNFQESIPEDRVSGIDFDASRVLNTAKTNFQTYVRSQRSSLGLS